jgi:hypothetical protein
MRFPILVAQGEVTARSFKRSPRPTAAATEDSGFCLELEACPDEEGKAGE